IDTYKALLYNGLALSTDPEITLAGEDGSTSIVACAASNALIRKDSIKLFYSTNGGTTFSTTPMVLTNIIDSSSNSGSYTGTIPQQLTGTKVEFYISAVDTTNKPRTAPYGAPQNLFNFYYGLLTNVKITPLPSMFELYQNYPNPFNPTTSISYQLPANTLVTLKVYDVLGRLVRTLVNDLQTAGTHSVTFDAGGLSSGVYFYHLKSGSFSAVKKLVLLK